MYKDDFDLVNYDSAYEDYIENYEDWMADDDFDEALKLFLEDDKSEEEQVIKIKYLPGSPLLEMNDKGGCIDVFNYEDITLHKGEFTLINLGFSCELPEGYDAILIPRSSCFKRYGLMLVNSPGYIDNSYNGTDDIWFAPVMATKEIYIPKGTRCFQFRLIKTQPRINFNIVNHLNKENRGGCGSTGF